MSPEVNEAPDPNPDPRAEPHQVHHSGSLSPRRAQEHPDHARLPHLSPTYRGFRGPHSVEARTLGESQRTSREQLEALRRRHRDSALAIAPALRAQGYYAAHHPLEPRHIVEPAQSLAQALSDPPIPRQSREPSIAHLDE